MPSYSLRFNVESCLARDNDLTLTFENHELTFLFSASLAGKPHVPVVLELAAVNNREAQGTAATQLIPPVLDALSFATGTPLLLGECELILKDEAGSPTRRALYVGQRRDPSSFRLTAKHVQEVESILDEDDSFRLPLCWHRYALDRTLALDQFVFNWLAFEALAGDRDIETLCPRCHTEIEHCGNTLIHRGSDKATARRLFIAANPETTAREFNDRIWGKARNSVFHGGRYPTPAHLVELSEVSKLLHRATDRQISSLLGSDLTERTHRSYDMWYRHFLFVQWATSDPSSRFAIDCPVAHLASMCAEHAPGTAHEAALEAGIEILNYVTQSPNW